MRPLNALPASLPRLLERPGKVVLSFAEFKPIAGCVCRELEIGLPFRTPPRSALADVGRLRPVLGQLVQLEISLRASTAVRWLSTKLTRLVDDLHLDIDPQGILLSGSVLASPGQAWFSVRLLPRQADHALVLELAEPRIYGVYDRPIGLLLRELVAELGCPLLLRADPDRPAVIVSPLSSLLLSGLAAEGWKVPLRDQVSLTRFQLGFGALTCRFAMPDGQPGNESGTPEPPVELGARLKAAEQQLAADKLDAAVGLWLAELKEKRQVLWCLDRLAQTLACRPETFTQPERVLENFLRARQDFPAGLLAAASLALRRNEPQAAAERFEVLARQANERPRERILSLTAAGQAMAQADPDRAAAYFEEALRFDRDHLPAIAGLAALPGGGNLAIPIRRTRRLLATAQEPATAAALHCSLGQLLLAEQLAPQEARRHFERALGLDPGRVEAVMGLASALVAEGGGEQGLALLAYQAERFVAEGLTRAATDLLWRRAQLAAALPGLEELARVSYRRILALDPEHAPARAKLVEAAKAPRLDTAAGEELELEVDLDLDGGIDVDIGAEAEPEAEVEVDDAPAIPDASLPGLEPLTSLSPDQLVYHVAHLVLELDPGRPDAPSRRGQLETALSAVEDWPIFLEQFRAHTESVTGTDLRIRLLLQGAEICETRLEDPLQAEEWYEQVLQLDEEQIPALDALIKLLTAREAWPRLVELLLKRAGQAQDTDHWAELLLTCAEVLGRRMGEVSRSISVLEAILESLPGHREARSMLAGSFESIGRFDDALAQLELLEDGAEGKALLAVLERKAQVLLGPLQRNKEGIQNLVRILKIDPDHEGALSTLDELYQERGNPKMQLAVVERRLANLLQKGQGGEDERILKSNLLLRRARLRREIRGDEDAEGIRKDLELALREWRENAEAAEELLVFYRKENNAVGLKRVLPVLIELMLPGPTREQLQEELEGLRTVTPTPPL